jgi:hypothetical protein
MGLKHTRFRLKPIGLKVYWNMEVQECEFCSFRFQHQFILLVFCINTSISHPFLGLTRRPQLNCNVFVAWSWMANSGDCYVVTRAHKNCELLNFRFKWGSTIKLSDLMESSFHDLYVYSLGIGAILTQTKSLIYVTNILLATHLNICVVCYFPTRGNLFKISI